MKLKRIVIYGRVSTVDQSHASQLYEVKEYCLRRWESTVMTTITDTASGTKTSRQGLDQLMKLVRRGRVDVIVCYKLDRLGRSLPHLAQIISELQMHVLMAVAEFERSLIVERVRAGQAAARVKGVKFGRPSTLWQRKTEVAELLRKGMSCRKVAAKTGLPLGSVFNISRSVRQGNRGEWLK